MAGKILVELMTEGVVDEDHEWMVYNYLMQAYAAGYIKGSKARSNKRPVAQLTMEGKLIEIFDSAAEAARKTSVGHAEICKVATGKRHYNTAGGFKWTYVNVKKDGKDDDSGDDT